MVYPGHGVCPRGSACQGQRLCPCLPWPAASAPFGTLPLSQLCRRQHQQQAAWQHIQDAWHGLLAQAPQPQVVHLEVLNRLMTLLGTRHQYEHFPPWLATFERFHADLEPSALDESQHQRLRE